MRSFPQIIPKEQCLSCDICCRFENGQSPWRPKVTTNEKENFLKQDMVDNFLVAQEKEDVCVCKFFNAEDQRCQKYHTRPLECLIYPFVVVKKQEGIFICLHLACPFVQETMGSKILQDWIDEARTFFTNEEVVDLLKKNPHLAGDYSFFEDELMDIAEVKL